MSVRRWYCTMTQLTLANSDERCGFNPMAEQSLAASVSSAWRSGCTWPTGASRSVRRQARAPGIWNRAANRRLIRYIPRRICNLPDIRLRSVLGLEQHVRCPALSLDSPERGGQHPGGSMVSTSSSVVPEGVSGRARRRERNVN